MSSHSCLMFALFFAGVSSCTRKCFLHPVAHGTGVCDADKALEPFVMEVAWSQRAIQGLAGPCHLSPELWKSHERGFVELRVWNHKVEDGNIAVLIFLVTFRVRIPDAACLLPSAMVFRSIYLLPARWCQARALHLSFRSFSSPTPPLCMNLCSQLVLQLWPHEHKLQSSAMEVKLGSWQPLSTCKCCLICYTCPGLFGLVSCPIYLRCPRLEQRWGCGKRPLCFMSSRRLRWRHFQCNLEAEACVSLAGAGPFGPFIQVPIGGGAGPMGGGPDMMHPMMGGGRGRGRGRGRGGFGGPMRGSGAYYDLDAPENQRSVLDYGDL